MGAARKQEQEQATTDVIEVADRVLRAQLPIEMPGLGHVNTYLLLDDDGIAVVDPGLPGAESWRALTDRLTAAGFALGDVHTVVVTHSHPDHFGGAGRLAAEAGAALVTHSAFRTWMPGGDTAGTVCDHVVHDVDPDDLVPYDWQSGVTPWGGEGFQRHSMRERLDGDAEAWKPPVPTRRLRSGETIRLAGRDLFAFHTPGHTLDHLCLHDPEAGLLFSGDHVLPTITPHISGVSAGRDPLAHFFASLDKTAALDDVSLVLPAHGQPFADLPGRCRAIKDHHAERIERLRSASLALGPATVMELSRHLFAERSWGPMAESETYAHLEHLRLLGQAERREQGGVLVYEVAAAGDGDARASIDTATSVV